MPETCLFRSDVHQDQDTETARCELLTTLMRGVSDHAVRIPRAACEACMAEPPQTVLTRNPALASLAYQQCDQAEVDRSDTETSERHRDLLTLAEKGLARDLWADPPLPTPACDVVLYCPADDCDAAEAVESLLRQESAVAIVHAIGPVPLRELHQRFGSEWNVFVHPPTAERSALATAHALFDRFETEHLAIQRSSQRSRPQRLSKCIERLVRDGGELCLAGIQVGTQHIVAEQSVEQDLPTVESLVMRRATFIDMGGVSRDRPNDLHEFVHRAMCEHRKIVLCDNVGLTQETSTAATPPMRAPQNNIDPVPLLRHQAQGFPAVSVACDVVLPFYGQIDFVREALDSILAQEDADVVIHLIDDASPEDASSFLHDAAERPQVRAYRNRTNIGQFASFNNVVPFLETDLVAVQDGDDISLLHRLAHSAMLLQHAGADIVGGSVELFGEADVIAPVFHEQAQRRATPRRTHRVSFYPEYNGTFHFLENPTALFRVSTFRELGGFADFGDRLANRASLDTEFMLRALYSNVRLAISREVFVRYRVHGESATQDRLTGWGTGPRAKATDAVDQRARLFRRGPFDARCFGGLGRYEGVTERI